MSSFSNSALRLLRRVLGSPARVAGPYAGEPTALDGNTAIAATEAAISEVAGLGASFPADTADFAWRAEQRRHGRNRLGSALNTLGAEGARGAIASALGASLGGARATVFLSSTDLAAAMDQLRAAAGYRAPLVLHLANRALSGPAQVTGSGHEALHMACDSGCFVLVASNAQEAVDFSLIARRVSEQVLVPGLVAMDGEQTALAMQDVRLAPRELITRFVGKPGDTIEASSATQRLVLGERRRRLPRRHDPEHPVLLGSTQASEIWGLAAASKAVFESDVAAALGQAMADLGRETGRRHAAVSAYGVEDASLVLMVLGAAVETAEAAADWLRQHERLKVGVLGLRQLAPFPEDALLAHLKAGQDVLVLERLDGPLGQEPPLLRELRAALHRAAGAARRELSDLRLLRTQPVIYGLGGLPLRGADLTALCLAAKRRQPIPRYLGLDFAPATSPYPKRQILLDRLKRDHPDIGKLGLRSTRPEPDLRPARALTLAIHRRSGQRGEGLAAEASALLFALFGGRLRSRPALPAQPWGSYCIDRLTTGPDTLRDPGAIPPVDLSVLTLDAAVQGSDPLLHLSPEGVLLILGPAEDGILWPRLDPELQQGLRHQKTALYALTPPPGDLDSALLGAICGVLIERGWLDSSTRRAQSLWETQQAESPDPKTAEFAAGLNGVRRVDYLQLPDAPRPPAPIDDQAPTVVRALGHGDDGYDSLPRFWDQVGVLYRTGRPHELTPDPYLGLGAIPPLSAAFRDLSAQRSLMPDLDPGLCTGCGQCWSSCPDNAVGAVAVTPRRLLDGLIGATKATALQPLAAKLAERMAQDCAAEDEASARSLGGLLDEALTWLGGKMPLPAERKEAVSVDAARLKDAIGKLPVAVTDPLFRAPESTTRGSGRLLFIAVEPAACKGCGICARVCAPGALSMTHQGPDHVEQSRMVRRAWEQLPDSDAETMALAAASAIDALAACLLNRRTAGSMIGGDGVESGSGARLALRLALAVAEAHQAPARAALVSQVAETRERIARLIRGILADALPADDLDALARGLANVGTRPTDLSTVVGLAEDQIGSALDVERLGRLVELARQLARDEDQLAGGRRGLGRATVSLVLSPENADGLAGAFPQNAFRIPVTVDPTGDGPQLAAGLLEAQLRQATEGLGLLRKARLELDKPADAKRLWSELDTLSWQELSADERATCPALLLVGCSRMLAGRGLAQLIWLLGSGLPVKVMVLSELDLGLTDRAGMDSLPAALPDPGIQLAQLALSQPQVFVAQTSLGAPEHLMRSLQEALAAPGPALIHLHAPSPARHGFATDRTLDQARLAVETRTLPLFIYDPQAAGVFGSRLDLAGNPAPQATWPSAAGGPVTPADWAATERRFADYLSPLAEDSPKPIRLPAYLALPPEHRPGQTPFISVERPDRAPVRYAVAPELARLCEERRDSWRILQELAGLVTPFTARVQEAAEAAVAAAHQAELTEQAARYEQQLAALRQTFEQEMRQDIRERLMTLAGYHRQTDDAQQRH
ncbi:pyruvate ferredoxin oxidoreductase [Thiorhodococcus mannitoliphagus]|uniref:Pyruvate ferredoxin oxidoreductase n=1 Tax=Thiorhodococcus mannitoliphagus TaxID=329406 RepID=A0A6P1DV72_9GAMM|nr:4Fe-4S binding protein [Thiorhodococcus mannitoliphagus]NEX21629.1 pyruvate ferredoxin oxidoreductase [Thiorhodococcus mannitoliphagus]